MGVAEVNLRYTSSVSMIDAKLKAKIQFSNSDYIHFVSDLRQQGQIKVEHVITTYQLMDSMTKPLSKACHNYLRNNIDISDSTPILRGHVRPISQV